MRVGNRLILICFAVAACSADAAYAQAESSQSTDSGECPSASEVRAQCALANAYEPLLGLKQESDAACLGFTRAKEALRLCSELDELHSLCLPQRPLDRDTRGNVEELKRLWSKHSQGSCPRASATESKAATQEQGESDQTKAFEPWNRLPVVPVAGACGSLRRAREECAEAADLAPLLETSIPYAARAPAEAAAHRCMQASLDLAGCRSSTRSPRREIVTEANVLAREVSKLERGQALAQPLATHSLVRLFAATRAREPGSSIGLLPLPRSTRSSGEVAAAARREAQSERHQKQEAKIARRESLDKAKQLWQEREQAERLRALIGNPNRTQRDPSDSGKNTLIGALDAQADSIHALAVETQEGLEQLAHAVDGLAAARPAVTSDAPRRQIKAWENPKDLYPLASRIEYAVLLVPDPRVPRHRRGYDLALSAVEMGMLQANFVLDRYDMPWQSYLDDTARQAPVQSNNTQSELLADDGRFGLLLYRKDSWREVRPGGDDPNSEVELRALLVVPETVTYGIGQRAFQEAVFLAHERSLLAGPSRSNQIPALMRTGFESFCGRSSGAVSGAASPIAVLGPNFSGSLSSLATAARSLRAQWDEASPAPDCERERADAIIQAFRSLDERLRSFQPAVQLKARDFVRRFAAWKQSALADRRVSVAEQRRAKALADGHSLDELPVVSEVLTALRQHDVTHTTRPAPRLLVRSAGITAASNDHLIESGITVQSLGVSDQDKLRSLSELFAPQAVGNVAILHEASVFGAGVCALPSAGLQAEEPPSICERATLYPFPQNISDLRFAQRQTEGAVRARLQAHLPLDFGDGVLPMAEGIDNGSEFPDSQRSQLTSISVSLQLDSTLKKLQQQRYRLVIVVATDVRDRLFLFDLVRRRLPNAQLIDLEADALLSHPDYLHSSRGVLMLASAGLEWESCTSGEDRVTRASFSTDQQASLFQLSTEFARSNFATPAESSASQSFCPPPPVISSNRKPDLHVVTRQGPSRVFHCGESKDLSNASFLIALASLLTVPLAMAWLSGFLGKKLTLLCGLVLASLLIAAYALVLAPHTLSVQLLGVAGPEHYAGFGALLGLMARSSLGAGELSGVAEPPNISSMHQSTMVVACLTAAASGTIASAAIAAKSDAICGFVTLGPATGLSWGHAMFVLLVVLLLGCLALTLSLRLFRGSRSTRQIEGSTWATDYPGGPWIACVACMAALLALTQPGLPQLPLEYRLSLAGGSREATLFWLHLLVSGLSVLLLFLALACLARVKRLSRRVFALAQRLWPSLTAPWSSLPVCCPPSDGQTHEMRLIAPEFAANPLLASASSFECVSSQLRAAPILTSRISGQRQWSATPPPDLGELCAADDSLQLRCELARLLVAPCRASLICVTAAMALALGQIASGWLYPVTGGDSFLLTALLCAISGGSLLVYALWRLPQLEVLDRLLCDGAGRSLLDLNKLLGLLSALAVGATAWLLIESPGVLDSHGGVLHWLTRLFK